MCVSTYVHSYSLQDEVVTIWRMIKLCLQDGLSEIITFCYVQVMFQLMAHGCSVMNQTVHALAEFCHRGLILPKGAVLTLVKQMEGEQTCSCHCTAYFPSSLWLVPSPRSSGLFRPAPDRVCNRRTGHLSYYFYFTT